MSGSAHDQGLLDTNILILRRWVDPDQLPNEMAISAVTLAELSAGPHQVRSSSQQADYEEHAERAAASTSFNARSTSSNRSRSVSRRQGPTAGSPRRLSPSGASHDARSPT